MKGIFGIVLVIILIFVGMFFSTKHEREYNENFLGQSMKYNKGDTLYGEVVNIDMDLENGIYTLDIKVLNNARLVLSNVSLDDTYDKYSYSTKTYTTSKDVLGDDFSLEKTLEVIVTSDSDNVISSIERVNNSK